jgi:hypothetical protein
VALGFKLGTLNLPGRCSTTGSRPQPFFALVIFQLGFQIFALGLVLETVTRLPTLSTRATIPGLFVEMGSH